MLPASSPPIYIPNPKDTIKAPLGFGAGGGTLRSNRRLLALRAAQFGSIRSPAGQNAPPERFVLPASSPFLYIPNPKNTIRRLWGLVPVVGLSAQAAVCLHFVQRNSAPFAPRPGKTLHRSVLYSRLRVPSFIYQTPKTPLRRLWGLVPVVGLEPTRCRHQRILSPSRLPIPSHRRICSNFVHISV